MVSTHCCPIRSCQLRDDCVHPCQDFLSESVHVQIALSDTLLKLPEPVVLVVIREDILFY